MPGIRYLVRFTPYMITYKSGELNDCLQYQHLNRTSTASPHNRTRKSVLIRSFYSRSYNNHVFPHQPSCNYQPETREVRPGESPALYPTSTPLITVPGSRAHERDRGSCPQDRAWYLEIPYQCNRRARVWRDHHAWDVSVLLGNSCSNIADFHVDIRAKLQWMPMWPQRIFKILRRSLRMRTYWRLLWGWSSWTLLVVSPQGCDVVYQRRKEGSFHNLLWDVENAKVFEYIFKTHSAISRLLVWLFVVPTYES